MWLGLGYDNPNDVLTWISELQMARFASRATSPSSTIAGMQTRSRQMSIATVSSRDGQVF